MADDNEAFIIDDNEKDSIDISEDISDEDLLLGDLEAEENGEKKKKKGFLLNKEPKHFKKSVDLNNIDANTVTTARSVIIDFLEGTVKKKEAMDYARGFIDNHYPSPQSCYIYAVPCGDVYAVEIHDGGEGHPYLPNILKTLDEDPTACTYIQNKKRILEVKLNDKGLYSSIILPEGIDSTETNIVKVSTSNKTKMSPYSFKVLPVLMVGLTLCALSFSFLILLSLFSVVSHKKPVRVLPTTKVENLPIQKWSELEDSYTNEKYVEKLSFNSKRWNLAQRIKLGVVSENEVKGVQDEITDIVKEHVKEELRSGSFLTKEEKLEIAKHIKEEMIGEIEKDGFVIVPDEFPPIENLEELNMKKFDIESPAQNNINEDMFNESINMEQDIGPNYGVMPPMEEYEFGMPKKMMQEEGYDGLMLSEPMSMPEGLNLDGEPDMSTMSPLLVE